MEGGGRVLVSRPSGFPGGTSLRGETLGVTSVTSGCDLLGPSEVSDLQDSEGLGVQGGIYQQASEIHTGVIRGREVA